MNQDFSDSLEKVQQYDVYKVTSFNKDVIFFKISALRHFVCQQPSVESFRLSIRRHGQVPPPGVDLQQHCNFIRFR
jgi:hypothetical protein